MFFLDEVGGEGDIFESFRLCMFCIESDSSFIDVFDRCFIDRDCRLDHMR